MKHMQKTGLAILGVIGFLTLPSLALAAGILGGGLVVQDTGEVTVTFGSSSAGYNSTLSLYENGNLTSIFSSNTSSGSKLSLGSFAAGTELTFALTVHDTGNIFYTGAGANNIDGIAHATVENLITGSSKVGFEDLLGGGDKDYNDLIFYFSNTQTDGTITQGQLLEHSQTGDGTGTDDGTLASNPSLPGEESEDPPIQNPEPSTFILLGSGLLGLGAWRLRRKSA